MASDLHLQDCSNSRSHDNLKLVVLVQSAGSVCNTIKSGEADMYSQTGICRCYRISCVPDGKGSSTWGSCQVFLSIRLVFLLC